MNNPLADPPAIVRPADESNSALESACDAFEDHGRRRLEQAMRIGQLLTEAKKKCVHGEWLIWLKDNFRYSRERAADFIRVWLERAKCGHLATFEEALQFLKQPRTTDAQPTSGVSDADAVGERGEAWEPPDEPRMTDQAAAARSTGPERGSGARCSARGAVNKGHSRSAPPPTPEERASLDFDIYRKDRARARMLLAEARSHLREFAGVIIELLKGPAAAEFELRARDHGLRTAERRAERFGVGDAAPHDVIVTPCLPLLDDLAAVIDEVLAGLPEESVA